MTFGALLSRAAYEYGSDKFAGMVPDGLVVDTQLSDHDATVFYSKQTNRAYVAFRGTNPKDWTDLVADAFIATGREFLHPRFHRAVSRTREVQSKYGADNVRVTGHSLGGTQAMYVNAHTGVPATAYNPGFSPFDLANTTHWKYDFRRWFGIGVVKDNTTVYRTALDPVSLSIVGDMTDNFKLVTVPQSGLDPHGHTSFWKHEDDLQQFMGQDENPT